MDIGKRLSNFGDLRCLISYRILLIGGGFDKKHGYQALMAPIVATKASLPLRASEAMWERSPDRDFEVKSVK